MRRYLRVASW
ncbi:hypothetical protein NGA_0490500 [Nannochloropsis gaditana CCMP526]|nr:hypothetical protein NGA_0490500 [Nannochloropsis gaditana CCMP526]EKU22770.1 hypothetical protein NGA_0490500 [Nannochloropsis gaditana CCMP526]|eukprot:XP_005853590.1 hypothetical protein NGA_0490500 [Nannochloropsis gaditana CCMP526]